MFGLLFGLEDGISMVLRNVGGLVPDYTAFHPRKSSLFLFIALEYLR
jgi:hypothetical protein